MKSMTAYAECTRTLPQGGLQLRLRSVNHKGLDLSVRLHPALFPLEAALRARLREAAQRGRLDLTVEVQDDPSLEPQLNRALLRSVAKAWKEDAEWLGLPPLGADAFFRMPGAFLPVEAGIAERLEGDLLSAMDDLLLLWNEARSREACRLEPFFREAMTRLGGLRESLEAEAQAQAAELPKVYAQRLEQVLKDANLSGQLPAERVVGEAGALAERLDIREELVRLEAHLADFAERLERRSLGGKWLDVWCQEVLRELNTAGSKCKRLAMTRTVMDAKQVLDQVREQGANLE